MKIYEIINLTRFWFRLSDQKLIRTGHFDHTEHVVAYPRRYGISPTTLDLEDIRMDYDPRIILYMLQHGWVRLAVLDNVIYIEAGSLSNAETAKEYCDSHFLRTEEYRVDIRRSANSRKGKSLIWRARSELNRHTTT